MFKALPSGQGIILPSHADAGSGAAFPGASAAGDHPLPSPALYLLSPHFLKPLLSCHRRDAIGTSVSMQIRAILFDPISTSESQTRLHLKKQNVSGSIADSTCNGKKAKNKPREWMTSVPSVGTGPRQGESERKVQGPALRTAHMGSTAASAGCRLTVWKLPSPENPGPHAHGGA